jgi:hypothetical protein
MVWMFVACTSIVNEFSFFFVLCKLLNGQFCCQQMDRMQDFTPFIPGRPGALSGPLAVGHLASKVAGALCVPDGPLTNCVGYQNYNAHPSCKIKHLCKIQRIMHQ